MRGIASERRPATVFYIVNVLLLPITLIGYVIWLIRVHMARWYRSKMLGRCAAGTPIPWSRTVDVAATGAWSSRPAVRSIAPRSGLYFTDAANATRDAVPHEKTT